MPLLQWNERYRVGIDAVDHEHRQLIDLINRLHDGLVAGAEKEMVGNVFGDLFAAISAHFALEEAMMRRQRYRDLAAHKEDHEQLLDEIRDIMDEVENGQEAADRRLAGKLDAWFSRHFETHDAKLHKALEARP